MDKHINISNGYYDMETVVAAASPHPKLYAHDHRVSSKLRQQQQQHHHHHHHYHHHQIRDSINAVAGNSSPKLAATFQGMCVNKMRSGGGTHSWPSAHPEELAMQANLTRHKQTTTSINMHKQQQYANSNSNNNSASGANSNGSSIGKLQKPQPPVQSMPLPQSNPEQQITTTNAITSSARMKPRNKSEEAINDLLQRIPDIGQIFDVHSRIGNGTFSTVLLATLKREAQLPDSMRRKFAIKHHIPTSHPDRIMKELQCMTDMGGTDNVVGIHCCLRCEASAAFVMPYMPHDRFHDFYTKMDVPEIRLYMRNLLMALRHVHKFNIIHRDVKPSNFLYNRRQGKFLLVDFGLAQHVSVSQQHHQEMRRNDPSYNLNLGNSKRPREREQNSPMQQATAPTAASITVAGADATLGFAVKRMRLHEEGAPMPASKMPLKPINEIAQCAKGDMLTPEDSKPSLQEAGEGLQQAAAQDVAAAGPAEPAPVTGSKYNTNRSAGGTSKCYCFANPSVCINCLMKKEVHASRAGTPGYRPPEVLLKYADQTTAVDIWAAGVIFLSILSSVYPFFKAPNDFLALAEIVTIFGDRAIRKTALALERMLTLSQRSKPLNLRKLCLRFRNRLIFSDAQMVRKHEGPDGRIDVCKNCDQYYFNCLCEESVYETEPLDPYECFPASAYDLLARLLEINPHKRITADEALSHPFFTESPDMPQSTATIKVYAEPTKQMMTTMTPTTRRRATKPTDDAAVPTASAEHPQYYQAQNEL